VQNRHFLKIRGDFMLFGVNGDIQELGKSTIKKIINKIVAGDLNMRHE
jgi:hypothetical protein